MWKRWARLKQGFEERRPLAVGVFLCVLLLAACGGRQVELNGLEYSPPLIAASIPGVSGDGKPFSLGALQGRVILLFFGYTHCPDVCPLTMAKLAEAVRQLEQEGVDSSKDIAVVMVSTDPERDTPEVMGAYVKAFHPTFYGVQPPLESLAALLKDYMAAAEKDPPATPADGNAHSHGDQTQSVDADSDYMVTHTSWIYAIDRQGKLRVAYSSEIQPEQIAADVKTLLADQ
jgi:protein SCO1/2